MKTIKRILPTILIALLFISTSCNKDESPSDNEEEQEENAIPQANTIVSTFAGDATSVSGFANGTGTNAKFKFPWHMAFDSQNNLFVADRENDVIRKITPSGQVSTFAGIAGNVGYTNGNATVARFYKPTGLVVDSQGNLFVSDSRNYVIRKITPSDIVSTFAGNGNDGYVDGTANQAEFDNLRGLAIDAQNNIYVADNHVIRKITPSGNVSTYAGSGLEGTENGAGNVATFKAPEGLVFDSQGNLFVADGFYQVIRKIDTNQNVTSFAGPGVNGFDWYFYLNGCTGIDIDTDDNLYISIAHGSRVVKITPEAKIINFAGFHGDNYERGHLDGTGAEAKFFRPIGMAVDSNGAVFISDYANNDIRKIIEQ